ncbi:MAG TPA: hypothetical protein VGE57_04485 [Solimonas sp.]
MTLAPVKRSDFSNGLVHLTRERNEYGLVGMKPTLTKSVPAFDVLKEILTSARIRGSGNDGFIKGATPAACFSEVPLSAVHQFASGPSEEKAKYRYYGVSLSKQAAFAAGARPVIYLPDAEGEWIPTDHKWRHVRFEHGKVDFTHEREWRAPGDFDLSRVPGLYVIVWSATEAAEVMAMNGPLQKLIRGVLPMQHLTQFL